ncbi:hypothetical protein COOONC_19099 [Cooperia oncophora]
MAKESEDVPDRDDDCDNSSDECDRIQTIEESAMPLEEILSRFYRQGYVIGRNLSKGKPSAEVNGKICCNNEEQECGEDKCPKGKRQSRSPTQEPAKRAKTEGNGSVLSMLINTDGEGDTVSTEVNASESADSVAAMKEAPTDHRHYSTNNSANNDDHPADEHKELEGNGQTPPIIKTKQKKVPVNADKKADDGIAVRERKANLTPGMNFENYRSQLSSVDSRDDDESEDDSDFNEAEEEAEDEECDDEEENESDDDTDNRAQSS